MLKKLYVGNLPYSANQEEIKELLTPYGEIHSLNWITDRYTGQFRGFGFVEMEADAAQAAIEALDGTDYGGRPLRVNEAHERKPRRD
jgi:RNA recognition motif-containing protein